MVILGYLVRCIFSFSAGSGKMVMLPFYLFITLLIKLEATNQQKKTAHSGLLKKNVQNAEKGPGRVDFIKVDLTAQSMERPTFEKFCWALENSVIVS